MQVDFEYLSRSMARLSGIPVRVYEGDTELFHFFPTPLPRDPMGLCRTELLQLRQRHTEKVFFECVIV